MRIQNNIMAMNTHRQLSTNNLNQTKSTEKLSSGYRINRAADDAAGLYISEKMRAQIRGLNQASANAQDGISLVQAAEGALQESHSILQRMRELGVKAANDVNESEDRGAIQAEIDQLTKEIDRIAFTTEFNKKTVLDGSLQNGVATAKTVSGSGVKAGMIAASDFETGMYTIETVTPGIKATDTYTVDMTGSVDGEIVTIDVSAAITDGTNTLLNPTGVISFKATGNVDNDTSTALNMLKDALGVALKDYYDVTSNGNDIVITAKKAEDTTYDSITGLTFNVTSTKEDGLTGTGSITAIAAGNTITGVTADVEFNGTSATSNPTKYGEYTGVDANGATITFSMEDVTRYTVGLIRVTAGRDLTLQVGANTSVDQTIGIAIKAMSSASLGIDNLRMHNNESSRAAVSAIENAIAGVSNQRSALGAVQNRLEHTVANLDTVSENLQAAESRIRDVDMAKEMMAFTKNNILSQAATAMLAQANQAPQTVLSLLR